MSESIQELDQEHQDSVQQEDQDKKSIYQAEKVDYGDELPQNNSVNFEEPNTQNEKSNNDNTQNIQQQQQNQSEQQVKSDFDQSYQQALKENNYQFDQGSTNIYMHHNKRILEQFLDVYKTEFFNYFKDFAKNSTGVVSESKDSIEVLASDLPLILRVGFYIDNISFHESKEDKQDLFDKPNSYKKVISSLSQFLSKQSNNQQDMSQIDNVKISYNKFLEFVNYFVNTDPDLFLKHNEETDYSGTQQSQRRLQSIPTQQELVPQSLTEQIKSSINKYQKLLEQTTNVSESQVILGTISALQEQLYSLQKGEMPPPPDPDRSISMIENSGLSFNKSKLSMHTKDVRQRNLKFLFQFYSKQQNAAGQGHTFDKINHDLQILSLGKVSLFCKQFNIYNTSPYLTKKTIPQIYKKVTNSKKELREEEFKIFLEKVAIDMYRDKDSIYQNEFEKIEAFYKFIDFDNIDKLKKKCKEVAQPFNIQEKEGFRLLPKDVGREVKISDIDQNRLEQLKQKKIKDKQKQLQNIENGGKTSYSKMIQNKFKSAQPTSTNTSRLGTHQGSTSFSKLNQSNLSHVNKFKYSYDNYAQRKVQAQETNIRQKQTFSWGELEKYTYEDLKQYQPGNFKPHDLIDEDEDEEDKFYLKEFAFDQEKRAEEKEKEKQVINVENYGNYQEKMRPTQKFLMKNDPNYDPHQKYISNVHRKHYSDVDQSRITSNDQQFYLLNQQQQQKKKPQFSNTNMNMNMKINMNMNNNQVAANQRYTPQHAPMGQGRFSQNNTYQNQFLNKQPKHSISHSILQRAEQVDNYANLKQQQQIDRLERMNQQKQSRLSYKKY